MVEINAALKGVTSQLDALAKERGQNEDRFKALESTLDRIEKMLAEQGGPRFTGGSNLPGAEKDFRLSRLIWAMAEKNWDDAPYELEVLSQAAKQKGVDVERVKAASLGSDVTLGNLVPNSVWNELIPLLRSQMILDRLGVRRMPGVKGSSLDIRRHTAAATGGWGAENTAVTASDQETDQLSLTPHKARAMTEISNTLLRAGSAEVEEMVRMDLVEVLRRLVQTAFFAGTGVGAQPIGIKNSSGIQTKVVGGAITVVQLQKFVAGLRNANIDENGPGVAWAFHPAVLASIEQIAASDTGARQGTPIMTRGDLTAGTPSRILGIPYYTTTDIAIGDLYLASWRWTMLADWGSMELAVSKEAGDAFDKDQTKVRVIHEVDVGVLQPTAVIYGSGITASTAL